MKAVFSTVAGDNGKKEKFIKRDSPVWKTDNESEEAFRKHITVNGTREDERCELLKGKSLGCWCELNECHGRILVDLFRRMFMERLYGFA